MKFFAMFTILALVEATILHANTCKKVVINNIDYEKEVLKEDLGSPYQLAVDYNTNTLLFSQTLVKGGISSFQSEYLNLKTKEFGSITGVDQGLSNAVDNKNHKAYIGAQDGIYEVNLSNKQATNLHVTDKNIWQLFYKDGLYFTTTKNPEEKAYIYKNGNVKIVKELENTRARLIAVDSNDNIFFVNSSGLFYHDNKLNKDVELSEHNVNAFTSDVHGRIYFSTPDGIYTINPNKQVEVLAENFDSLNNVWSLAIDGENNIIYSTETSIVRLVPAKKPIDC